MTGDSLLRRRRSALRSPYRPRVQRLLYGPPHRWRIEGYAVGDHCLRYVHTPNLPAALWRYAQWRWGGVNWAELRLRRTQR